MGNMCTKFEVDPTHMREVTEWTQLQLESPNSTEQEVRLCLKMDIYQWSNESNKINSMMVFTKSTFQMLKPEYSKIT